ncbi:MAG: hypothetical protein IPH22_09495 [Nitrosomonas sp.]|nr:hypothetical protein [Nitrosomonas sp.]
MSSTAPSGHFLQQQTTKTVLSSAADKSGLPAGTLVHVGEKHESESKITVTQYNADTLTRDEITSIAELQHLKNAELITWVNVDGLSDIHIVVHPASAYFWV